MKSLTLEIISENTEFEEKVPCEKIIQLSIDSTLSYKVLVTEWLPQEICMAASQLLDSKEYIILCNPEFYSSITEDDFLRIAGHEIGHIECGHVGENMLLTEPMSEERSLEIELEADAYACNNFVLKPTVELYGKTFAPILAIIGLWIPEENLNVIKKHLEIRKEAIRVFG